LNVHVLPDRAQLDARSNLERLVERARASKAFGDAVEFDAAVWDLAPVKPARPSAKSAKQAKLYFATHEDRYVVGIEKRTAMTDPFAAFLKAMIVLREEARAKAVKDHGRILRAGRSLYAAMGDPDRDPVNLVSGDFVAACNAIRIRKTQRGRAGAATTAYRLGQALAEIAEFVNRHEMSKARVSFFNPFRRVTYDHTKVDDDARKERAEKMATKEEIGAIIDASLAVRRRGDDRGVLRIAVVELMCSAPVRINEILYTRADCRRTERTKRKATGEEVEYLGYAYDGSKRAPDSTKWIPSVMVDIADRALADAKRITEPYREIARWMESHPGRTYIAEPWRLADPETLLSHSEVGKALGLAELSEYSWLDANGLRKRQGKGARYRLGDIEQAILRQQPKLPDLKSKLSDFMFLVPKHFFRGDTATQNYVLTFLTDAQISDFLGCKKGFAGVFERLKILDADNQPYRINSHSVRHFLNTLAQMGLLSQLDIARWSGRKDVGQNADYDHSGGIQYAEEMRKVLESDAMKGPIVDTVASLPPADRDAFLKGRFATAHLTSIGACLQDFSLAPCPSHGACAGCSEHVVVKGKPEHQAEAERLLGEHQAMLDAARAELADGTYNASAWVAHNEKMVEGLKKTVGIHQNPDIADGTVVQV
jgi:hypothetical protein